MKWPLVGAAAVLALVAVQLTLDRAAPPPSEGQRPDRPSSTPLAAARASQESPSPALSQASSDPAMSSSMPGPRSPLDQSQLQQKITYLLQTDHLVRLGAYVESLECKDARCTASLAVPSSSAEYRSQGAGAGASIVADMKADLRSLGLSVGVRSLEQSNRGLALNLDISPTSAARTYVLSSEDIARIRRETLQQAEQSKGR